LRYSRTSHFEVHRLSRRHWHVDAIFADRGSAIADAKRLMRSRRGLDGVRVLRVEEKEEGFLERPVYLVERPRARRYWPLLAVGAPAPRQPPSARASFTGAPALTLAGLLLACGLMLLLAHRPAPSDGTWVFDRPEAWQPHAMRNPWTGEVSRPGGAGG
jgi:hypothetical protein